MKIALIGYGKMGHEIEKIALSRGHSIQIKIDKNNLEALNETNFNKSDIAIEFTQPDFAVNNYKACFKKNIPVVSGTTGWLKEFEEISQLCNDTNQSFFYASNFSIGVNIFFELNKKLAQLMNSISGYDVEMNEIHHAEKLDEPSGTAISLAEQIIDNLDTKTNWSLNPSDNSDIKIKAERIKNVPGTHSVLYKSDVDEITIKHEAKNRKGFALGAVLAAEFLVDKKGVYNMQDLLSL